MNTHEHYRIGNVLVVRDIRTGDVDTFAFDSDRTADLWASALYNTRKATQ